MASGDLLEVGELDLERDGPPTNTGALTVPPHLVDDVLKRIARGFVGEDGVSRRLRLMLGR